MFYRNQTKRPRIGKNQNVRLGACLVAAIDLGGAMKRRSFLRGHWVRHIEADFLRTFTATSSGKIVLDVGSGPGYVTFDLLDDPPEALCLTDTNLGALREARSLASNSQFSEKSQVVRCRGEYLPFKTNSFDLVLMISSLEHFVDDTEALHECFRILKSGGVIAMTTDSEPRLSTLKVGAPWLSLCKPRIESEVRAGSTFLEALLAQHAELYNVKRRYSSESLEHLLRDAGFVERAAQTLLRSRLSKILYELCVSLKVLSFDVNNPGYRLMSRLYPLIVRSEKRTDLKDGYVVGAVAKAVKEMA